MITRILIVDDDDDDRELFCSAAEGADQVIKCTQAIDGKDALNLLISENYKPDFIFLDLNMPRINGFQFLKEVKKYKKLGHVPIVIYTTSKRKQDQEETKKLGAVHFITKPDNLKELLQAISFVLERKWERVAH